MLIRPQFKWNLRVEAVEGEGILVLSERDRIVFPGRIYALVAPLIDGHLTCDEIINLLRGRLSPAEVYYTFDLLEKKDLLCESDASLTPNLASWWHSQGMDLHLAKKRLAETTVAITSLGDLPSEPLREVLRALGVRTDTEGSLGVVITDDYLRDGLQTYNQQALSSRRSWLLCRPVGCQIWVGPLFVPGRTGCWECLAERLRANRVVEGYAQRLQGRTDPLPMHWGFTPTTLAMAWSWVASIIEAGLARGQFEEVEGKVQVLDVARLQMEKHVLVRRPQCPVCGNPQQTLDRRLAPVTLNSCGRIPTHQSGHRACSPAKTLERFIHHVSSITGVVRRLERAFAGDAVHLSYLAACTLTGEAPSLQALCEDMRDNSSGKGVNDLQARVSGLCEALECHSFLFRGDEPQRRTSLAKLGDSAIHPNACMLFSEEQYRHRDNWSAKGSSFFVPEPFDEEVDIEWTPIWSLTRQEHRFLPAASCYYRYPDPIQKTSCLITSNGNAAGNTLEEAILHGLFEVVERDAVGLWWYNRVRRPGVDLKSFGEPYLEELRDHLHNRRREFWILDLTSDLGIPVFAALSRRLEQEPERITLGFGAHLNPVVAVLRAATELSQLLAFIMRDEEEQRDTLPDFVRGVPMARRWQPFLGPDTTVPLRRLSDYRQEWSDDLREDVLSCQRVVERHGMEVLVLDVTRADIELPVVKVIVPGLRTLFPRFAPGRLYDVPVKLGWLTQPLCQEDFNPEPLFPCKGQTNIG